MDSGIPPQVAPQSALSGRIPLAVVVVDADGLVSHWSSGARRLFGSSRDEAVGMPATDLLPVAGVLAAGADAFAGPEEEDPGFGLGDTLSGRMPYPAAGRARMPGPGADRSGDVDPSGSADPSAGASGGAERIDVVWWAYPLVGAGPERLLVLAADALGPAGGAESRNAESRKAESGKAESRGGDPRGESAYAAGGERDVYGGRRHGPTVAPGFALHTEFPGADDLAAGLPEILPGMSVALSTRIAGQVLELGYPVLEFSHHDRVPVTPDWGVPRRPGRPLRLLDEATAPVRTAAVTPAPPEAGPDSAGDPDHEQDLEHAAVRERLEFLNEVSSGIGSSLDLERTIREVTSAAVPRFADFAGTHLRAAVLAGEEFPDGAPDITTVWHRVWVEHNDEPGRWDDTVPIGECLTFPEHTPFSRCMATGEPVLIPRINDDAGDRASERFDKRDLRPLINGRSLLIVPLKARDAVLGFMVLMRRSDRDPFDAMDRVTGAELAARAGLVLDNARMYTQQEQVAETLQDSMLPQVSPRLPGCDTATRYLPGTRLGRVGGDWFDTIKLPGSRTALVVGDVMGHGITSAAMMGQLRTAVQTLAALDLPPAQLLRSLDDLAQRLGEHYLATCLYAVYDPIRSELRISNAGHIPPVLVRAADGRGELLQVPTGAPIGVGGVPFGTATVRVAPGDRLVLCTDGLVEVRGQDIGAGLAALCESAAHPAASMDDACDAVIRALAATSRDQDLGRKDDVALLMARLNGIPHEHVATWRLGTDPREARRARRLVRERLTGWGLDEAVETAELLVSEAVTNAVRHARTDRVELRLVRTDALLWEVSDDDHALPALLEADREDVHGRGLRVVGSLTREWGTSSSVRGKTVWFEQSLPGPPVPSRTAGLTAAR
ncbi:SpoIIE family protein phosphatase [Streptomyces sp. NPDC047108]|uniref:SpoIIE family protein phosphatase n=1 Tax=Streptomyces sp. NPDC047108 TaxID=3155025 RepID=UPI0033E1BCB5